MPPSILRKIGRSSRIKTACVLLACLAVTLPSIAPASEDNFFIPGVDVSRLDFTVGAWCRYLVVDKALGIEDSTEVYFAVTSRELQSEGDAYWVEIQNKSYGAGVDDAELYKLLIRDAIRQASEKDTLVHYVARFYIKKGNEPIAAEDPARLREFSLGPPTSKSQWIIEPGVTATTPAGDFSCEKKKLAVVTENEIPTGRITLIEKRNDRWSVWFAEEVPVFHIARCLIERSRETKTVPEVPGIPTSGRRESETVVELLGFGYEAEPLVQIEP
jgi:hypothetical protein